MKNAAYVAIACMLTMAFITNNAFAQFEVNGQMLERFEYRNGYGNIIAKDTTPAAFVSSRTRLQFGYKVKKITLYASIQDVRTFGSTSQLKLTDGFLSLHEAWAELKLDSGLFLKVGRQELNYDNARFLGNVDWTIQGRAHDFVLLKFEKNKFKIHIGGGYNQDAEKLYNNIYTTVSQYKTAQMLRAEYTTKKYEAVVLFWNDGRQFISKDTAGKIIGTDVRYTQTVGVPALKYKLKNTTISAFYYHQFGRDIKNKLVDAFDASLSVSHILKLKGFNKPQLTATLGAEALSGTEKSNLTDNNSFSPLYGTNHIHNGYMDYFYVGGRHENSVGLYDMFIRLKYDFSNKVFVSTNAHYFNSYAGVYNATNIKMSNYLGTELDITAWFLLMENAGLQVGYSHMFATSSLETLRNVKSPQGTQNWAYLMLIIRPKNSKMFTGMIF